MLSVLAGALIMAEASGPPSLPREFRGVWVATVDNIDWPSKPGLAPADQRAELRHLLRTVANAHFNAIVFQIRPSADALYKSTLEPTSWFLTGRQGAEIEFDPLQYAVAEGHRLGLEVHAWFNPFRSVHPAQKGPCCALHVSQSETGWSKTYGKYQWLDPGIPEVRDHSLQVMMDVVDRYDIDGIHIDDYFYPYPEGGRPFPDDDSYSRYTAAGGRLERDDWRRHNIDNFVQGLYQATKKRKPWVKVGISPFGIYRPGVPESIKAGLDQYGELYADCRKWLREGWCDYMAPQLYWKVASKGQPFEPLLKWWIGENVKNRHVWPGLYTSQIASSAGNWPLAEVSGQIAISRKLSDQPGQVHFSAKALLANWKEAQDLLPKSDYLVRAVVPAVPWCDDGGKAMQAPKLRESPGGVVTWNREARARFYEVWIQKGGSWRLQVVSSDSRFEYAPGMAAPQKVAVKAVSRSGLLSDSAVLVLPPKAK